MAMPMQSSLTIEQSPVSEPAMDAEWRALGMAAPARRALVNAGLTRLEQLAGESEDRIAGLHGMGPNALSTLRTALRNAGLDFQR